MSPQRHHNNIKIQIVFNVLICDTHVIYHVGV